MTEYGRFDGAHDLLDLLAKRKAELGLSNASLDDICDWPGGVTDKYIGPSRTKPIGIFSLFMLLDALALSGTLYVDDGKESKRQKDWATQGKRKECVVRPAGRISKAMLQQVARVRGQWASLAAHARSARLSPERRRQIAAEGARARWENRQR